MMIASTDNKEIVMGWWGHGVMEGDPPMDAECDVLDALGDINAERTNGDNIDPWEDGGYARLVALLKEDGVTTEVYNRLQGQDDDNGILWQAFGEMIITSGGILPVDVKERCINAARSDDWAAYEPKRKAAMDRYVERLEAYTGTPLESEDKGLLETIGEHIAAGKTGIVNVVP